MARKNKDADRELMTDQLLPHAIEAEKAVLGSVLVNPETLSEVGFLVNEAFFVHRHGWIWDAFYSIKRRGDPIDYLTVVNEIEQTGKLAEAGGAAYILSLINETPSSLNIEGYGRIVERMYTRRELVHAAEEVARAAHSAETDIGEVCRRADAAVTRVIIRHSATENRRITASDAAADVLEQSARYRGDPGKLRGMVTGLAPVDKLAQGVRRKKLYYVTARPGVGKSAYFARMARGFASNGLRVLFYALEMTAFEMVSRMACQMTNIKWDDVESGTLSDEDFQRWQDALLTIDRMPLDFDESGGLSIKKYWNKTTAYEREIGLPYDVVFVDTINCARGEGKNDTSKMTDCSRSAKDWAHDNLSGYALIISCQLNRSTVKLNGGIPSLEALRDSGALEEDGDAIWGLHRPGMMDDSRDDNLLIAEVLKGRQYGLPVGSQAAMAWNGACFGIEALAHEITPPVFMQHSLPGEDM